MDALNQEKILGYFIEEAKEHLETLEKGILELSSVIDDNETINEMFRAAHSIKGGGAMLGYTSIQKTAHRLEDAFKILRDEENLPINDKLEDLFLKGYDVLSNLIEHLEGPLGLEDEKGLAIYQESESIFLELQESLDEIRNSKDTSPEKFSENSNPKNIPHEIRNILQEMLEIFKQDATNESRQELLQLCNDLKQLAPEIDGWKILIKTASKAIANPKYTYLTLAPVIIKEIKLGSDLIELDKPDEIYPSRDFQKFAAAKSPQILVTVDPKSAASALKKVFNRQQLSQLVQLLQTG